LQALRFRAAGGFFERTALPRKTILQRKQTGHAANRMDRNRCAAILQVYANNIIFDVQSIILA
jgi:hypothetical protein